MALIPGWLADLLGFRAAVDSSGTEFPQRRLLKLWTGFIVSDNEDAGFTLVSSAADGESSDGTAGATKTIDFSIGLANRLLIIPVNTVLTLVPPPVPRHIQIRVSVTAGKTISFVNTMRWKAGVAPTWSGVCVIKLFYTGTEFWDDGSIVGLT